jgi:hypothetical protein
MSDPQTTKQPWTIGLTENNIKGKGLMIGLCARRLFSRQKDGIEVLWTHGDSGKIIAARLRELADALDGDDE